MADLSDVEEALVALVAGILYPAGPAAPSIVGRTCRVYRGWPAGAALDADLAAGRVNVTVFPEPRPQEVTTRYPDVLERVGEATPRLSISVAGRTATVSGEASLGQVAGLLVDGMAVVHRTARGDTPEMVAAVLAAYLRPRHIVTVSGASLTVAGAGTMVGRVVADQTMRRETRRQRQVFRVSLWCPDPATRDRAASAIDAALSARDFIALADGCTGRLLFRGTSAFDQSRDARLFRRDLLYAVDYATTLEETLPSMVFGALRLGPPGAADPLAVLA